MKKKTLKDLREHFPVAEDSFLDARALAGDLPECEYPNNGVPELRDDLQQVSIDELFAVGNKRG